MCQTHTVRCSANTSTYSSDALLIGHPLTLHFLIHNPYIHINELSFTAPTVDCSLPSPTLPSTVFFCFFSSRYYSSCIVVLPLSSSPPLSFLFPTPRFTFVQALRLQGLTTVSLRLHSGSAVSPRNETSHSRHIVSSFAFLFLLVFLSFFPPFTSRLAYF